MARQKIAISIFIALFASLFVALNAGAVPLYSDNVFIGSDSVKIEIQKTKLKPNITTNVRKSANDKIVITVPSVKYYDKPVSKHIGDGQSDIIRAVSIKNVRKNKRDTAQISIDVTNSKLVDIKTTNSLSKTIIIISSKNASKEEIKQAATNKLVPVESEDEHGDISSTSLLTGVALADNTPAKIASLKIAMGQIRILTDKKIDYKLESASGDGSLILSNVTGFNKHRVQDIKDETFDSIELNPLPDNKLAVIIHPTKAGTIYSVESNDNNNELRIISYLPVSLSNLRILDDGYNKKIAILTKDPIYNYKVLNRDNLKSLTLSIPNGKLGANKNIEGQSEDISYKLSEQDNKLNITISFTNKYIVQERVIGGTKLEFDLIRAKGDTGGNVHTIAIDPGHGGNDNGADGDYSHEKDINLIVAKKLSVLLSKKYNVVMTRQDDRNLSLEERIEMINSNKPDISISIHCNSNAKTGLKGFETYYFAPPSANFASIMHLSFQQGIARDDRGIKKQPFALIKYMAMPAILVEMEYISNSDGEAFLNDPAAQDLYAKALAEGIDKYFAYIDGR